MKRAFSISLIILFSAIWGCNEFDTAQVSCPFPPADSDFPIPSYTSFEAECEECFLRYTIRDQNYEFSFKEISSSRSNTWTNDSLDNVWLNYQAGPIDIKMSSVTDSLSLYNAIGQEGPLISYQEIWISGFDKVASYISATNYCKEIYEISDSNNPSESFNRINGLEPLVTINFDPYIRDYYKASGDFELIVDIDGKEESITGEYLLPLVIFSSPYIRD